MDKIFWVEGESSGKGGIYYRDFGLAEFINKVETQVGKVVALHIEGNNIEVLVAPGRVQETQNSNGVLISFLDEVI